MRASRLMLGVIAVAIVLPLVGCTAPGTAGIAGADGAQGTQGEQGPSGAPGLPGAVGAQGETGPKGASGSTGPQGAAGGQGATGPQGVAGLPGLVGPEGVAGARGAAGPQGVAGERGATGPQGIAGPPGLVGPQGEVGPQGVAGPQGADAASASALFYALMPMDNAATVAVGGDVQFPQDGPATTMTAIVRWTGSEFMLVTPGVYRVSFQVPVSEAGQLVLSLNGVELPYTVTGRATGTSLIGLTTLVSNSGYELLTVRNPVGNSTALTITPLAGGTAPVAATLLIELVKAS